MDVNFVNQNPYISSSTGVFHCGMFLNVALSKFWCMFTLEHPQGLLILLSCYLSIQHFCYVFPFLYISPKLFYFFCFRLLHHPCSFSTNRLVNFSFVILEFPVFFLFSNPVPILFESFFLCQYLDVILKILLFDLLGVVFLGPLHYVGFLLFSLLQLFHLSCFLYLSM